VFRPPRDERVEPPPRFEEPYWLEPYWLEPYRLEPDRLELDRDEPVPVAPELREPTKPWFASRELVPIKSPA
jgi:hypothetical protein